MAISADGAYVVFGSPASERVVVFHQAIPSFLGANDFTQLTILNAANGTQDDFGASVAIDAHGDILLVGAPLDDSWRADEPNDNSETDSGAIFVYRRRNGTFAGAMTIKETPVVSGRRLGSAISLAANGSRFLAAAGGTVAGFEQDAGAYRQSASQPPSPPGTVHILPRLSHDGRVAVVGSDERIPMFLAWSESGGTWSRPTMLSARNAEAGDDARTFLSGDGSAILVTAPGEDSGSTSIDGNSSSNSAREAGAAYVFRRRLADSAPCVGYQDYVCGDQWRRLADVGQVRDGVCTYATTSSHGGCDGCFDQDGDGHFQTRAECAQGDDCLDTDENVFSGQTSYFYTRNSAGTYDYNCDNSAEMRSCRGDSCGAVPQRQILANCGYTRTSCSSYVESNASGALGCGDFFWPCTSDGPNCTGEGGGSWHVLCR